MKVLMTGATGMVGREVGKKLILQGHEVYVISRDSEKAKLDCPFPCQVIEGSLEKEALRDSRLRDIQAVIHLAGESISEGRWSDEKKKRIYDSRAVGTKNLLESLKESRLQVFVSTSASGFYGDRKEDLLNEDSVAGTDFLSHVCQDWERPVWLAQSKNQFPNCRYVVLRTGVVFAPFAGALKKMLPAFRHGVGGALGDGEQWISWIHLEDLSKLYLKALEDSKMQGPINAVSPEPVKNKDFSARLAKALGSKLGLKIPNFAIKALYGEMAQVLLNSQRIESPKLRANNFQYQYSSLDQVLEQLSAFYKDGEEIFYAEQFIPQMKNKVFPFFADAKNLEKITPPILGFQVLNTSTPEIQSGTLINYRLKVHGLPMHWRTEILDWNPDSKFVDNQLKGPYRKWHHTHEFSDFAGGTLMTDLVRYKLPLGLPGWIAAGAFVAKDVQQIFSFRKKICSQIKFGQF